MSAQKQNHDSDEYNSFVSNGSSDTIDEPVNKLNLYGQGKIGYQFKIKTEICKYWSTKGQCRFGQSCAFAHGKDEIRDKIHIPLNYRTKQCKKFQETGSCIYGERCQFQHISQQITHLPDLPYQSIMEGIEKLFTHRVLKVRLPTFESRFG